MFDFRRLTLVERRRMTSVDVSIAVDMLNW